MVLQRLRFDSHSVVGMVLHLPFYGMMVSLLRFTYRARHGLRLAFSASCGVSVSALIHGPCSSWFFILPSVGVDVKTSLL